MVEDAPVVVALTVRSNTLAAGSHRGFFRMLVGFWPVRTPRRAAPGSGSTSMACLWPSPIGQKRTCLPHSEVAVCLPVICSAVARPACGGPGSAELGQNQYAGCNVLCADRSQAVVLHAGDWLRSRPLPPGLHVLTAHDVNDASDRRIGHALWWLSQRPYATSGQCVQALKELCPRRVTAIHRSASTTRRAVRCRARSSSSATHWREAPIFMPRGRRIEHRMRIIPSC